MWYAGAKRFGTPGIVGNNQFGLCQQKLTKDNFVRHGVDLLENLENKIQVGSI